MLFFAQCFGAVLDLIHLRFQRYKARRVFSAAGQLVCVVSPTRRLKFAPSRRALAVPQSPAAAAAAEQRAFHAHLPRRPRHLPPRAPGTPCTCPLSSCQWEGRLEVAVPHLRQAHRVDVLQGAERVFVAADAHLPAPAAWLALHACLGHHFLLVLSKQERLEGHPQFFATMMLVGTPTQADRFTYRLELSRDHRRLQWEATPRSVLERVDSVVADGDCLVLNTSLAQLFSDNGSLAIGIAIRASEVRSPEADA